MGGVSRRSACSCCGAFWPCWSSEPKHCKALIVLETGAPVGGFIIEAQVAGPLRQIAEMLDLYAKLPEIEENPLTLDERINT